MKFSMCEKGVKFSWWSKNTYFKLCERMFFQTSKTKKNI